MAATGDLFDEGPRACPFVALEHDRDRRADAPDYRHRCFAEPTPAPRAIAHQEAYCLSPNFSTCPIFQDWAVRAAARPVPVPAGYSGQAAPPEPPEPPEPPTSEPVAPEAAAFAPADDAPVGEPPLPSFASLSAPEMPQEHEQLAAFDGPAQDTPMLPSEPPTPETALPEDPYDPAPPAFVAPHDYVAPPQPEEPPVPAFLADREGARPRSSNVGVQFPQKVAREDVLPSWEIDGRYGAQASESGGDDRHGGLITTIAVIAILALGVAGVIFLPGLLAGGAPAHTPNASAGVPSAAPTDGPSIEPSSAVSLPPASAPPTDAPSTNPTPEATPQTYRIKAGDTLAKIARRKDTTVEEILAANPQIADANHIEVGQRIVIPPPVP